MDKHFTRLFDRPSALGLTSLFRPDVRRIQGFTLIELLFVVMIIAILVGLAVPAYTSQVVKARRADGISVLTDGAQLLERCFSRFNAYNNGSCPAFNTSSPDGYYLITVVRTASTFTLTAAPQGAQASDACGNFTIDHLGNKTPVPGDDRCWGTGGNS